MPSKRLWAVDSVIVFNQSVLIAVCRDTYLLNQIKVPQTRLSRPYLPTWHILTPAFSEGTVPRSLGHRDARRLAAQL